MITKNTWTAREAPIRIERIEVRELEDHCFVRTMQARSRDAYDESVNNGERTNYQNLTGRLVARCLCDEQGEFTFAPVPDTPCKLTHADWERAFAEGAEILGEWPTPIVERLYHWCRVINGMVADAVERAAKNSEPDPESSSSTD